MDPASLDPRPDSPRERASAKAAGVPIGPCLLGEALRRAAQHDVLSDEETRHVQSCVACGASVRAEREDAAFLARARVLVAERLGPASAPRLPGYRMIEVLSSGAQGVVFKAVQESTARTVAIKSHPPGEPLSARQQARAEREAEIAARLQHPNVVTIFESRVLPDGRVAVVMEFVDGVPLDCWTPPGATPMQRRRAMLRAFAAVCAGVHHAHLNGVIHRDLKPENILVTQMGRPVVVDFGVAKLGGIGATISGEFQGTPAYASPEQALGTPGEVDALTDVYSLGVVLYRLLCGASPYELSGSLFDMARTIAHAAPAAPRSMEPTIPADLEAIVLRALRKDRQERYQSAAAFGRDIERFLAGEPVEARSGSGWYLLRKALAVNRRWVAMGAVGLLIMAAAGGVVAISVSRAARAAEREAQQREQAHAERVRTRAMGELLRATMPAIESWVPHQSSQAEIGLGSLHLRLETGAYADEPDVDRLLRRLWAGIYGSIGAASAAGSAAFAEASLRTSLMQLVQEHGQSHPEIASAMHDLTGVLLYRSNNLEAERYARATLRMREDLLGPGSVPVAETRALLARVLLRNGKADEAATHARSALASLNGCDEKSTELLRASLNALLGRIELASGRGAEGFVLAALTTQLRRLPPNDLELLATLDELASLSEGQPECGLAGRVGGIWGIGGGSSSDALRRDVSALRASDAASAIAGRAAALGRLLRLQEQLLGEGTMACVGVLIAQKEAASREGLQDQSATAALRAAELLAGRFGAESFAVLACVEDASISRLYDGRADEAVDLARWACRILDAVPEPARDRYYLANERRYLSWFLTVAGRHEQAILEWRATIARLTEVVGPEHYGIVVSQTGLAFCLSEVGCLEEADGLSEHTMIAAEGLESLPLDWRANVLMTRGHVLCKLDRQDEARPLLERAWEALFKRLPERYGWRRTLLADLAASCEKAGDFRAAELWRGRMDAEAAQRP